MYYLQSRYYNPELGRFINADGYAATGQGLLGSNMFVYCLNNPVNWIDPSGLLPKFIHEFLEQFNDWVATPLGILRYVTTLTKKGELYEFWVDSNDIVQWGRHYSDHGNPKEHPFNPHDHRWFVDDDGNNKQDKNSRPPDPGFQAPNSDNNNNVSQMVGGAIGAVGLGYLIYVGAKWIIAGVTAPVTGGGSLIVAGVTP